MGLNIVDINVFINVYKRFFLIFVTFFNVFKIFFEFFYIYALDSETQQINTGQQQTGDRYNSDSAFSYRHY